VRPATAFQVRFLAVIFVALAAGWGSSASAAPFAPGASLGMLFPAGSLTSRSDYMGSSLLPGPAFGVFGRWGSVEQVAWEGSAEITLFQGSEDPGLQIIYVPVQAAAIREVGKPGGLSLQLRGGIGPAFISANQGETRSLALWAGSLGWRIETSLKNVDCALEAGLELLLEGKPQTLLRFRVMLFMR